MLQDIVQLTVQAVILIGLGFAFGRRASALGLLLGLVLTLLIGAACAAASNAVTLTTKSEDVMAPLLNMVMMPILLLWGILLPMTIGPTWLQRVSDVIPVKHIVSAIRDGFAGDSSASRARNVGASGVRVGRYARHVRTFFTYTLARIGLFAVAFGLVWLVGFKWLDWNSVGILWSVLIALAVSAVAALLLLRRMRDDLASHMHNRASRMSERIEKARRVEDVD